MRPTAHRAACGPIARSSGSPTAAQEKLFAHDLEGGERLPERDIALADRNRDARGIWSDDETMWVLDGGKESLFAYDLASGELAAEYALDPANDDPRGLFFDGVTFWVSDHGEKRIFAYRLEAGEDGADALERNRGEEFPNTVLSRAGNNSPRGLWSDGDVMYVADESDDKIYTLQHARRDRCASRLAHAERRRHRGVRSATARTTRAVVADGVTDTTVERGGDAAPRGRRHRPARHRRGCRGLPGCPGGPRRDHGHRHLGGRQPRARLPCAPR